MPSSPVQPEKDSSEEIFSNVRNYAVEANKNLFSVLNTNGSPIDQGWWGQIKDSVYEMYLSYRLGSVKQIPRFLYINYSQSKAQQHNVANESLGRGVDNAIGRTLTLDELSKIEYGKESVRICCISDTHERHTSLTIPPCDVLIHTGDILFCGRKQSVFTQVKKLRQFNEWLKGAPAQTKIVLGGNHDAVLTQLTPVQIVQHIFNSHSSGNNNEMESSNRKEEGKGKVGSLDNSSVGLMNSQSAVHYLDNAFVTVRGLRMFGTPSSKGMSGNKAFQGPAHREQAHRCITGHQNEQYRQYSTTSETSSSGRESTAEPAHHTEIEDSLPYNDYGRSRVDVLLSHGLDLGANDFKDFSSTATPVTATCSSGSKDKNAYSSDPDPRFPRPLLHVWGHHHKSYGAKWLPYTPNIGNGENNTGNTEVKVGEHSVLSVCATTMDSMYQPVNLPVVIDLPLPEGSAK